MENEILELSKDLSSLIVDSESFSGHVTVMKFDDGTLMLQLTHYHDFYKYSNTFIAIYDFNDKNNLEKFKKQAIDCIEGKIFLEDLGREEDE